MYSSMLLALAVAIAAPGPKEPPKKEPSIVGEWVADKVVFAGMEKPSGKNDLLRFTFAADGKLTINDGDRKPESATYKLDTKKKLAEIEIIPPTEGKDPTLHGIFKIDGNTLTLCLTMEQTGRPAKFESTMESKTILVAFTRAKK